MNRFCCAASALLLLAACHHDAKDSLPDEVQTVLAAKGCEQFSWRGDLLEARCAQQAISWDLTNLRRRLGQLEPTADRAQVIRDFVLGPLTVVRTSELPKDKIFPILKTHAQVDATLARLPPDVRKTHPLPAQPFVGDLVLLIGEDFPNQVAALDLPTIQGWKTTPEALMGLAMQNLAARPVPPIESVSPRVVRISSGDGYDAVRIMVAAVHQALAAKLGGQPAFAIPDREELLAARADDPAALEELRDEAARRFAAAGYPLTPEVIANVNGEPVILRVSTGAKGSK